MKPSSSKVTVRNISAFRVAQLLPLVVPLPVLLRLLPVSSVPVMVIAMAGAEWLQVTLLLLLGSKCRL